MFTPCILPPPPFPPNTKQVDTFSPTNLPCSHLHFQELTTLLNVCSSTLNKASCSTGSTPIQSSNWASRMLLMDAPWRVDEARLRWALGQHQQAISIVKSFVVHSTRAAETPSMYKSLAMLGRLPNPQVASGTTSMLLLAEAVALTGDGSIKSIHRVSFFLDSNWCNYTLQLCRCSTNNMSVINC